MVKKNDGKKGEDREIKIVEIPLSKIKPDPDQPRKDFNENKIARLAKSIESQGLLTPIIVRPHGKDYYIIIGERRYRAVKNLGWKKIPAEIRTDKIAILIVQLMENIAREDLNPMEEAEAYMSLRENDGLSHPQIAESVGKSANHVSSKTRLLALPKEVQNFIRSGELQASIALVLIHKELSEEEVVNFAKDAVRENLSSKSVKGRITGLIKDRKMKAAGVTQLSDEAILEISAQKNMPYFLDRVAAYIIHISEMDVLDQKLFFKESFKLGDRATIAIALLKITKRAEPIIKTIKDMAK